MLKFAAGLLVMALSGLLLAAPPSSSAAQEPVYIVLYSRFYDHSHPFPTEERLHRLLPLLEQLRKQYPQSGISALFQFSGTVSEVLQEGNGGLHLVDQVKDFAQRGLVEVGYTGEDEPSYLYRPKPKVLEANTPEERWAAKAEAEERFLTDFKNPVTGLPVPGLTGGLKRTEEVFGPVAYASGVVYNVLSGDSAMTHVFRKMNPSAILVGVPKADPTYGSEGFAFSAANFSHYMSPDAFESPELFWEDNVLRLSDSSLADNKPHTTDEPLDALKPVFQKLDRSRPRVIKLEIASYKRYLNKRADGSILYDPLQWMYYHPDEPKMPVNMKPLVPQGDVDAGYRNEEAVLKWLLEEFLPANPGSRFVSVHELAGMVEPHPSEVSASDLKLLASDLESRFVELPMTAPDFGKAGNTYFTLSESFHLLAQALAKAQTSGSLPKSVPFGTVSGPLLVPDDMGATTGSVLVGDVMKKAEELAPRLAKTGWTQVPEDAVPYAVTIGTLKLNASQMLRLMAQAYLDPTPSRILKVNAVTLSNRSGFMFPHNAAMPDQTNEWAFKPAPLRLTQSAGAVGAAQ